MGRTLESFVSVKLMSCMPLLRMRAFPLACPSHTAGAPPDLAAAFQFCSECGAYGHVVCLGRAFLELTGNDSAIIPDVGESDSVAPAVYSQHCDVAHVLARASGACPRCKAFASWSQVLRSRRSVRKGVGCVSAE